MILYIDLPVAFRLMQTVGQNPIPLLKNFSHLGRGEYYLIAAMLMLIGSILLLRSSDRRRRLQGLMILHVAGLISGTLIIGHLIVFSLKQMAARLRPSMLLEAGEYGFAMPFSGEPFTSLPSPHVFTAFAMATILSRLQPKLRAVFFGSSMMVALQRILAQQHFISDIFISLFLALIVSEAIQHIWQIGTSTLGRRLISH